jgi:hypothetical protein
MKWSLRSSNDWFSLTDCYTWLVLDFVFWWVLAWYFDNVLPTTYGVKKAPWFVLTPGYWFPQLWAKYSAKHKRKKAPPQFNDDLDEDVLAEQKYVLEGNTSDDAAVVIDRLVQTFIPRTLFVIPEKSNAFHAVRGVTYHIKKSTLFCLLGHNGAGKVNPLLSIFFFFGASLFIDPTFPRQPQSTC